MVSRARQRITPVLIAAVTMLSTAISSGAELTGLIGKLNLSGYRAGTKPPEFSGQTIDGRAVSLASLHGTVVILNFWATWCQECRPEMPLFERLQREFGAQGLRVIGINAREGPGAIRAYGKELGLTFPLVLDPRGEINAAYGVIGLPSTFVIGRDGRAVARGIGAREWAGDEARAMIRALLAEPPARKRRTVNSCSARNAGTPERGLMSTQRKDGWTRREFLGAAGALGAGAFWASPSEPASAEPPPETRKLRLVKIPSICQAPQFVAEEFFRAEGFSAIEYIPKPGAKGIATALASGEADINLHFNARLLMRVEAGDPIVILAGGHVGCFELFANERVRTVRDLKGKAVGVLELESSQHAFIASIVAHVGLDPRKDIRWIPQPPADSIAQLADGKIDAFLGFPPDPQRLRSMRNKSIHVLVNSMADRPWSQYFCCMVTGNREFVRKHPVATKRALRAILNASSPIAHEPERTARFLVDRGFTQNYNFALDALKEMGMAFTAWREFDPEDTLRFYALRLHESGMIKSSPQKMHLSRNGLALSERAEEGDESVARGTGRDRAVRSQESLSRCTALCA